MVLLNSLDRRLAMYIDTIPFKIKGIPCFIGVVDYFYQPPHKGSPYTCWSDVDYMGDEEIIYFVLDRKGYKADWLAKKIDDQLNADIEKLISKKMESDD